MASLNSLYVKYDTLKKIMHTLESKESKGEEVKGISFTVSVNDEANQWEQNVNAYVEQSKEDREAKKDKFYIGNGKTFWSNGSQKSIKEMGNQQPKAEGKNDTSLGDLPF
jgi:hypothetical protein